MCFLEEFLPEEIRALEVEWQQGRLQGHARSLVAFVQRHAATLAEELGPAQGDPAGWRAAVGRLVRERRTVDLLAEVRDQREEIDREIWYRGERGDYDRERIIREWVARWAEAWRGWRVKQYLYVVARCAERLESEMGRGRPGS